MRALATTIVLALASCRSGPSVTPGSTPALATVGDEIVALAEFEQRLELRAHLKVKNGINGKRRGIAEDLVLEAQLRQACADAGIVIDADAAFRLLYGGDARIPPGESEATLRAESASRICEHELTARDPRLSTDELFARLDRDYPVHFQIELELPPNRRRAERVQARERALAAGRPQGRSLQRSW